MTKTELLKDLMRFQVSKYNYRIVGHSLYFILPNNNFAVAKLINTNKPNDYNGISITCVNVPFGEINACELLFSDIFYDETATTIIRRDDGSYGWYRPPTVLDKLNLSDHIGKYFEIISFIDKTSMFASSGMPYLGLGAAAIQSFASDKQIEYRNMARIETSVPDNNEQEIYEPIEVPALEDLKENDTDTNAPNNDILLETEIITPEEPVIEEPVIEEPSNEAVIVEEKAKEESIYQSKAIPDTADREQEHKSIPQKDESEDELSEPLKKKSIFGTWFRKKEPTIPQKPPKATIEKSVLTEMKDAVRDSDIPKEKIFKSWDIQGSEDSDVKAALKKTQDDDYELRIFGKGEMANLNLVPWEEYAFNIRKIIVYEGVTTIGANAFKSLKFMETAEIADTVTKIGPSAFEYCENLTELILPKHLEEIGEFAFSGCDEIHKFVLPDNIQIIGDYAFDFDRLADLTVYCSNPNGISLGQGIDPTRFLVKKTNI